MQNISKSNSLPSLVSNSVSNQNNDLNLNKNNNDNNANILEEKNIKTNTLTKNDDLIINNKTTCLTNKTNDLDSMKSLVQKIKMLEKKNQLESLLSPRITIRKFNNHNHSNYNKFNKFSKENRNDKNDQNLNQIQSNNHISDVENQILAKTSLSKYIANNLNNFNEKDTMISSIHSDNKDPVRVIKITEIIEINNNDSNSKFNCSNQSSLNYITDSNISNFNIENFLNNKHSSSFISNSYNSFNKDEKKKNYDSSTSSFSDYEASFSSRKNPYTNNRQKEFKQLPILIEKATQNDQDNSNLETNNTKNTEIVLEIINISETNGEKSNYLYSDLNKNENGISSRQDRKKPKKITIKITGRTRSSDPKSLTQLISPNNKFDQNNLSNNNLNLKNSTKPLVTSNPKIVHENFCDGFKPISSYDSLHKNTTSFKSLWNNNDNINEKENDTSTCFLNTENQPLFNLDKFKSYLKNFNDSDRINTNRSCSMPPKITNFNNRGKLNSIFNSKNNNNTEKNLQHNSNQHDSNYSSKMVDSSILAKRTSFRNSSRKLNLNKNENKIYPSLSDVDEPVWAYRDEMSFNEALSDPNKDSLLIQPKKLASSSLNSFHRDQLNKNSKFSSTNDPMFAYSNNELEINDQFSSTLSILNDTSAKTEPIIKSTRENRLNKKIFKQLSLNHNKNSLSDVEYPTIKKSSSNLKLNEKNKFNSRNSNFKTISSYYNKFYSTQNDFRKKNLEENRDLFATSYINEEDLNNIDDFTNDDYYNEFIDREYNKEDDTEADEDFEIFYNESSISHDEKSKSELKKNSFTTFSPLKDRKNLDENSILKSSLISNSPKTPKLTRRVIFADQFK